MRAAPPGLVGSVAAALGAALTSAVLLAGAAPAQATDELALSADGTHWDDRLGRPLFDPRVLWVPGDVRTATFYVRNRATVGGELSVEVVAAGAQTPLDGVLEVEARVDGATWSRVTGVGRQPLVERQGVAPGRRLAVDVRITMPFEAANTRMIQRADLDFSVTLAEAVAEGGTRAGLLPDTGSPIPTWLSPIGLMLIGGGSYLVLRRRDHSSPQETP